MIFLSTLNKYYLTGRPGRVQRNFESLKKILSNVLSSLINCLPFQGPVVISRDHHDVSGTDSPYRETSNISDGSAFTAGNLTINMNKIT